MKLRLTQDGFASYTGQMGVVQFVDGLSIADVKPSDAVRMAAVMQCEWEDGSPANVAQAILDNAHTPAPMAAPVAPQVPVAPAAPQAPVTVAETVAPAGPTVYTRESLEAVADQKGIKGLREIAAPLGIKAHSIAELIDEILAATPRG